MLRLILAMLPLLFLSCRAKKGSTESKSPYEALNSSFSKSSSAVYYEGQVIAGANASSFTALDENYGKDDSTVFFCDYYRTGQSYYLEKKFVISEVKEALLKSFGSLGHYYAKDSLHAYFKGERIRVKHVTTFRALNEKFARDTFQAYYNQRPIIGSDGGTFTIVDMRYSKDKKFVYYSGIREDDANSEFVKLIPGARPDSFQSLDGWFAKDISSVFYQFRKVKGADPNTIKILEYGFARDDQHVFFENAIVDGADVKSFVIFPENGNLTQLYYFTRDKDNVYWKTGKVAKADPNHFTVMGMGYGKDNQHVYYGALIAEGADPKTFKTYPHRIGYADAEDASGQFAEGKRIKEE